MSNVSKNVKDSYPIAAILNNKSTGCSAREKWCVSTGVNILAAAPCEMAKRADIYTTPN